MLTKKILLIYSFLKKVSTGKDKFPDIEEWAFILKKQ